MGIFFKSSRHKERFEHVMREIDKIDGTTFDREYASLVYLLTAHLGIWDRAEEYVSSSGIRVPDLLDEVHFSSGEATLIKWGGNLFNENMVNCNPVDLMGLDEVNFQLAVTALLLRRHGYQLEEEK